MYTDDWGREWLCTVLYYEGVFTKVFVMAASDQWFVYTEKLKPIGVKSKEDKKCP